MIRAVRYRITDEQLPPGVSPIHRADVPSGINRVGRARQAGEITTPGRLQPRRQSTLIPQHRSRPIMGFRRAFQQDEQIHFYIRPRMSLSKQESQFRVEFFGLNADQGWQVRPDRPGNVEYRLVHLNPSSVGTYPHYRPPTHSLAGAGRDRPLVTSAACISSWLFKQMGVHDLQTGSDLNLQELWEVPGVDTLDFAQRG
jgi:hypothetical protein